jgi:hypothetical protein
MAILSSNNCCSYNSFLPQLTPPKLPTLTIASTRPHFKTVKHTQLCFEIKKTMKKKKKHEGSYLDDIVVIVMWVHDGCYCSLLWAPMMMAPSSKQSIIQ